MSSHQQSKIKIMRAIGVFLIMVIFITFRYPKINSLLVGGLLLLGGFACIMIAALMDEELKKIPIISVKSLDIIIFLLFYILLRIAQNHFGIEINTEVLHSLSTNNAFFIVYLLFVIVGLIRVFL
jgi:hypothetical protein